MQGDNYKQMPAIHFVASNGYPPARPLYMYSQVAMYPAP